MNSLKAESRVRYEGGSSGTEIWGMTQANFLVATPGRHAKETAVNLTDAAAVWLAKELGEDDSKAFRQEMASQIGEAYLTSVVEAGLPVDSLVIASEGFLEDHPDLVARFRTVAPAT